MRYLACHKRTVCLVKDQEVARKIGTKRKGKLEEQNLINRCKKPRFWTEEEEYSQQKPERQELQAKILF